MRNLVDTMWVNISEERREAAVFDCLTWDWLPLKTPCAVGRKTLSYSSLFQFHQSPVLNHEHVCCLRAAMRCLCCESDSCHQILYLKDVGMVFFVALTHTHMHTPNVFCKKYRKPSRKPVTVLMSFKKGLQGAIFWGSQKRDVVLIQSNSSPNHTFYTAVNILCVITESNSDLMCLCLCSEPCSGPRQKSLSHREGESWGQPPLWGRRERLSLGQDSLRSWHKHTHTDTEADINK